MRKMIVAANWKMHLDMESGLDLTGAVISGVHDLYRADTMNIVLCPPFPFIGQIYARLSGSPIRVGAQNVHEEDEGAFTGEVSVPMLKSVGCSYVIVGHSERRMMFAETDSTVGLKANVVVGGGMSPIICVGETAVEREDNRQRQVVERQLKVALNGLFDFNVTECVIAYEPVWAIGTGKTATPEQAEEMHAFIRERLAAMYRSEIAEQIPIIYGGSVRADNAEAIFAMPNVDGGLIGGASLKPDDFTAIVKAAARSQE